LNKDEIASIKIGAGGTGGVRLDTTKPYGDVRSQAENSFIKVGTTTVTANGGGGDPGSTEPNATSAGAQIGGVGGSSSGSRSGATGRGEATRGKIEDSDGKVVSYTAFGNQGGAGATSYRAGGGGGATTEGKAASDVFGGAGGEGLALDITGTMVVYGSGGGGGAVNSTALGAGLGGTGAGNGGFTTVATSALANQGGGGGGGGRTGNGGNGGSGIVVIRYTIEPEWTPPMPEKDGEADFKVEYNPEVLAALEAKTATSVTVTVNGVKLKGDKAVEALNTAVKNFDDALTFDETAASLDIVVEVTEVNVENPAASKYVVKRGDTILNVKDGANVKTKIKEINLGSDAVIFKLVIE
jgi:hypothetical protein